MTILYSLQVCCYNMALLIINNVGTSGLIIRCIVHYYKSRGRYLIKQYEDCEVLHVLLGVKSALRIICLCEITF